MCVLACVVGGEGRANVAAWPSSCGEILLFDPRIKSFDGLP